MVFLFRSGTLREKLALIFKATRQHARNLATFATIYKASMLALRRLSPEQKEGKSHTFLAGLLGGYVVFGRGRSGQSSVNRQIVMYVFARVVLALAGLAVQSQRSRQETGGRRGGNKSLAELREKVKTQLQKNSWPVFAAMSWGLVMWLFRWHPDTVQSSLRSSMKYMWVLPLPPCHCGIVCKILTILPLQICGLGSMGWITDLLDTE